MADSTTGGAASSQNNATAAEKRGGTGAISTPANSGAGIFGSGTKPRRRSSASKGMFGNLAQLKSANTQRNHDSKPQGVVSGLWNKLTSPTEAAPPK